MTNELEQLIERLRDEFNYRLNLCGTDADRRVAKLAQDTIAFLSSLAVDIERNTTAAPAVDEAIEVAIDMVLFCPMCGMKHVDAPEPENGWTNPPHRSHKCHGCGTVWRPADVPTNGVSAVKTQGKDDTDTFAWANVEDRQNRATKPAVSDATFEELLRDVVQRAHYEGDDRGLDMPNYILGLPEVEALRAFHVHALQSPMAETEYLDIPKFPRKNDD